MRTLTLKETRPPYTVTMDDETLLGEPVLLEHDGKPVAAIVPLSEYDAFLAWRKQQKEAIAATDNGLERDRQVFLNMKDELLENHAGEFAIIKDGKLVAVGPDEQGLVDEVYERFGAVDLYVKRIEPEEHVYHVTGPRLVRKA